MTPKSAERTMSSINPSISGHGKLGFEMTNDVIPWTTDHRYSETSIGSPSMRPASTAPATASRRCPNAELLMIFSYWNVMGVSVGFRMKSTRYGSGLPTPNFTYARPSRMSDYTG